MAALTGRRPLLDWQCGHLLGLGNTQLPLLYVVEDFGRVALNLLGISYVVRIRTNHLGGLFAGFALFRVGNFFPTRIVQTLPLLRSHFPLLLLTRSGCLAINSFKGIVNFWRGLRGGCLI